jgi:hypothetical protein
MQLPGDRGERGEMDQRGYQINSIACMLVTADQIRHRRELVDLRDAESMRYHGVVMRIGFTDRAS